MSWPNAPGSIRSPIGCPCCPIPAPGMLIENVAERCGWASRGPAGSGRGLGLAWSRYKNKAAYACVAVELDVDLDITLRRVWCAADAGLVINPDGARNQLEGGIVQAASMTLKEQVTLDGDGITSLDWDHYPIMQILRGAGHRHGHRAQPRSADIGHGRMHVRPHRGGDRQCRGTCAGDPDSGHAVDARTDRCSAGAIESRDRVTSFNVNLRKSHLPTHDLNFQA